jgi:chemotaxis protein MotB
MMQGKARWAGLWAGVAVLGIGAVGCGYSEEEWQAQLDKYNRKVAEHQSAEQRAAKLAEEIKQEKARVAQLQADLQAAGVDIGKLNQDLASRGSEISKLSTSLEEQRRALEEYKSRARQLEKIKQRFERLRAKLMKLTSLGLKVKIRNNRMIISLPGDVLFPSGRDKLKKEGEEVLAKVASIIRGDAALKSRHYQVAGHTDNQPFRGGTFGDNWGLSLMRARSVLLYLIDADKGQLHPKHWSAAGFGDIDPIANNGTPEGRQTNRRCELIVVPSAEEMLDLKAIAQ